MKKKRIAVIFVVIMLITMLFSGCLANVPVPKIKEGRFDFSVTYEINGEERTSTGVYVCKYEGSYLSVYGSGRDWKGYVENGDEWAMVAIHTNDDGVLYVELGFYPEYFMSDPDSVYYETPVPRLCFIYHSDDPDVISSTADEEEIFNTYGVKLTGYTYADPIENSYDKKFGCVSCHFGIN